MASQESLQDFDLNIYFVVFDKHETENDCSSDMWNAYNRCDDYKLSPVWITETQCNKLKPGKEDVFVMEEFDGELFQKFKSSKCSIVGPRCLLTCFISGLPIPEGTSPVFTTAMRKIVVCASGFSPAVKDSIQKKVEYMGGIFTRQFRNSVTHLITNSVMSEKYEKAIELGVPIVTEKWVEAIWETSLQENVTADSPRFDKYQCPVFMNLVVTASSLPKPMKEKITKLITEHGGVFMRMLDGARVKIVVAPESCPLSEKLKFAMQHNIACVKPEWVMDSVDKGHALSLKNYQITTKGRCSTPVKSNENETLNFSGMSTIQGDTNSVDETLMTNTMASMERSPLELTRNPSAAYVQVLERLNLKEAKMAGPFLDGCNIYLTGFPPDHREKLNRILNVGSATRLDDISDALTHVIVGDPNKAVNELKSIKSKGISPYILTIDWLEQSMKTQCPAMEENFIYELKGDNSTTQLIEPPSPLSKKNLQLLQKPVKRPPVPVFDIDKPKTPIVEVEEPDLVQEYLKANTSVTTADKSLQEFLQPHNQSLVPPQHSTPSANISNVSHSSNDRINSVCQTDEKKRGDPGNETPILSTQASSINERVLEGSTLILVGFDDDEGSYLNDTIKAMGGEIVPASFKGIPDYAVIPIQGAPLKHTVNEIVTPMFIEDCIDQEKVVDVMYYHKPISITEGVNPLAGCVIATSSYTGKERAFLTCIVELLGGRHQDIFARRTNLERDALGCTHLVCPSPEGNKYKAAVKWKLPAVTAEWLMACATQQRIVEETPFLIGETMAPERLPKLSTPARAQMRPPSTPTVRQIITPKRHLIHLQTQGTPGMKTPINKNLNIGFDKTLQSPFHISTPETPYGAFLKPDPSPETRKRWLKWAEAFPDMKVEEPPPKRRQPSTPLSQLKRQLWEMMKVPIELPNAANAETVAETLNVSKAASPASDSVHHNSSPSTSNMPINRVLSYNDENSPIPKNKDSNKLELHMAQLDQVLTESTKALGNKHSLSAEKKYDLEPDTITKYGVKDSQSERVEWEPPVNQSGPRKSTIHENKEIDEELARIGLQDDVFAEVRANEEQEKHREIGLTTPVRKFMLSGIKERTSFEEAIKTLGGEVSVENYFDDTATHLLCIRPARNEKILASMAAGKWVLHCAYLKDSEAAGKFLDEEKYEWGNPVSIGLIPKPDGETEELIAASVYRWRLKLLREPSGALKDMVALCLGPKEKCVQYSRLICAGGGTVVEARPPYNTSPKGKKITHCFIQLKNMEQSVDWAMMASKGILCFQPQYISDYLTSPQPLDPRKFVLPEFRKYLSLLPK